MNRRARIAALLALAALAACGRQADLERTPGMTPPPVAYGEEEPQTSSEMLTPKPQLRPIRNEDLLKRSEPRREDPFNTPPGPDNGR